MQGAVSMNSAYHVSCVDQVKQVSFVGGLGVERGGLGAYLRTEEDYFER